MTVIVGAATVAVHHLALWYVAPNSIFNYDAPLWVVLVHASFVALETFAACFIARNFFDNVIGLEKKVEARTAQLEERNREKSAVLSSIEQGIVRLDEHGRLQPEHSPAIVSFFGEFEAGETFADYLSRSCVTTAQWFSMNWDSIEDGFLPIELALDQLPKEARIKERNYLLSYRPEFDEEGELESLLIVVTDNTSQVAQERAESQQRELLTMLEHAIQDPRGFLSFHSEATSLLGKISGRVGGAGTAEEKRALHTMKGNAAAFGLASVAEACHGLEEAWAEGNRALALDAYESLTRRWEELSALAQRLLGPQSGDTIRVETKDIERALDLAIEDGAQDSAKVLAALLLEPTSLMLERLADQALALAGRLDKGEISTKVDSNGIRVKRDEFDNFFQSMTHVVRNAVDHGLEPPLERESLHKPAAGTVQLSTEVSNGRLAVSIEDDGRGINWDLVRERASDNQLPCSTHEDLVAAIFSHQFTTRDEITEAPGRGVGLAAVKAVVDQLDGEIQITSSLGKGTRMQFDFPLDAIASSPTTAPVAKHP